MNKIQYIKGDLFEHIPDIKFDSSGMKIIIPHVCNNIGCWGSGFVIPLGQNFPIAKKAYMAHVKNDNLFLGQVSIPLVDDNIYVANMIAQEGIMSSSTGDRGKVNHKPIRYAALCKCLEKVNILCKGYDVYAPKFGSNLAGGNWDFIEELIEEILIDVNSIKVFYL